MRAFRHRLCRRVPHTHCCFSLERRPHASRPSPNLLMSQSDASVQLSELYPVAGSSVYEHETITGILNANAVKFTIKSVH